MIEINGESFVFTKTETLKCVYQFIRRNSIRVYSVDQKTGLPRIFYEENRDYTVNYEEGTLQRTADSRIPDFSEHVFFGVDPFNHADVSDYGNEKFTVYTDYISEETRKMISDEYISGYFPEFRQKAAAGKEITIVIFGDSISTGCEAVPGKAYYELLKEYIESEYALKVRIKNYSVCGDTSVDAMKRIAQLDLECDIGIIAFGMNDANRCPKMQDEAVPPRWYEYNIGYFAECFMRKGAEVMLVSPHIPNPKWIFSSGTMREYANALQRVAEKYKIAFADVYRSFFLLYQRGKNFESMLGNNINHPNSFGHHIYFETLKRFFCGGGKK